jgi:hypothetical protein
MSGTTKHYNRSRIVDRLLYWQSTEPNKGLEKDLRTRSLRSLVSPSQPDRSASQSRRARLKQANCPHGAASYPGNGSHLLAAQT